MSFFKTVGLLIFSGLILVSFQNCGHEFNVDSKFNSEHQKDLLEDQPINQVHLELYNYSHVSGSVLPSETLVVNSNSLQRDPSVGELLFKTYAAYSPESIDAGSLVFGGWISEADPQDYLKALNDGEDPSDILGPDKIFFAEKSLEPRVTEESVSRAFALLGYHVNDPTIVRPPSTDGIDRSSWLYMYFTMLDNNIPESCRQAKKNLLQCPEVFTGHDVGLAVSTNNGKDWEYVGIIISAALCGDAQGAWMPTAFIENDKILLYYSTGRQEFSQPNIYRQVLNANGITREGLAQPIQIENFQAGQLLANIDIVAQETTHGLNYLMLGNSGDQKHIQAFYSYDGLSFSEVEESPVLSAKESGQTVLTPSIDIWGQESLDTTFAAPSNTIDNLGFAHIAYTTKKTNSDWEMRKTRFHFTLPDKKE